MSAEAVISKRRIILGEGKFIEAVVWRVPNPVRPSEHLFKYRLVYIEDRQRVVGYDNEKGKGDHSHYGGTEAPYAFTDVDRLMDDFVEDVKRWRIEHGTD